MKTSTPKSADYEVTIVSRTPDTLRGLESYLQGSGVSTRCARDLDAFARLMSPRTLAVVLFPDDFRWEHVASTLADLAARQVAPLPIVVTARPQRFEKLTIAGEVVIVPRPVWGWTILETIREQIARRASSPAKGGRGR